MESLIPKGEIAVSNKDNVEPLVRALLEEGYVVMLSYEEQLVIINYIWSSENYPDRNDVVFMPRDIFELEYYRNADDEEEDEYEQYERIRRETREHTETEVWWYARKLMDYPPSTIEKIFCLDMMTEEARDRFWSMYPDQLSFSEVKQKIDDYEELRNAALGERVMEACLADLDRHNQKKYDRIMREEAEYEDRVTEEV